MIDDSHSLPICACPSCGTRIDAASSLCEGSPAPVPGDITICIDCAAVMRFDKDLTVRLTSPAELRALHPDTQRDLARAQRAIRRVQAGGPN